MVHVAKLLNLVGTVYYDRPRRVTSAPSAGSKASRAQSRQIRLFGMLLRQGSCCAGQFPSQDQPRYGRVELLAPILDFALSAACNSSPLPS